ncbi:hypothetical protein D6C90_07966 [Aureobasidium pullulans]|uniref:BTB domain-containing protein n=1 Tax=Aureobasidium pullulans TaxID=5580 RepID=A0A4S9U7C7_AURPU|nr:hypothetical protein D6D15_05397 [Aureobasidium pullulans]THZ33993.1 hypothetical protein D6C90_07966 [Aureobasidium pullulans]
MMASNVFNDSQDSDIIIQFGDNKVYAHRVILRMWSPYFDRALRSNFAVAKSPVFHLGGDDDVGAVYAILRHMYNMPYNKHPANRPPFGNDLKHHIEVFKVADKYDCLSLRHIAQMGFRYEVSWLVRTEFIAGIQYLTGYIAQICGPNAPYLADPSLRNHLIEVCIENFGKLAENTVFQGQLEEGRLFDADASTKILAKVGSRVQDGGMSFKRRRIL